MIRLSKMLARAGASSRRGAESLIQEGRVAVNGKVVLEPATMVDPEWDQVSVDGRKLQWTFSPLYILMNKPKGVVTTLKDPEGRPTVRDLLKGIHRRVFPVGRLDFNTEGALLLTNDGELAQRLLHPRYQVERTYWAKVKGIPTSSALERLRDGIELEPGVWARARARLVRVLKANSWLEMSVREGRYREVRRMCEALGHPVIALKRMSFGSLSIRGLPAGAYRHLTLAEVQRLRRGVNAPGEKPAETRGTRAVAMDRAAGSKGRREPGHRPGQAEAASSQGSTRGKGGDSPGCEPRSKKQQSRPAGRGSHRKPRS